MKIDSVSRDLVKLALYLDSKIPGSVSEIWLDPKIVTEIKESLPGNNQFSDLIETLSTKIIDLTDQRRKTYLLEVTDSLTFQLAEIDQKTSYSDFSRNTFGFQINRVTETELAEIEASIKMLESKLGKSRFEVLEENRVDKADYKNVFKNYVEKAKTKLPSFLTDFPDQGFEFELTSNKPWSAFNSHIAPFKSRLTLNADIEFDHMYLHRLAFHEAYGGHHSELSHKDKLLVEEGRGEHGLVITYSPQTFVSEAIAESVYVLLGGLDNSNKEQLLAWYYDRLAFALQNLASFMHLEDKLSPKEINSKMSYYGVTEKVRSDLINFSTDTVFGKYAPVYYSAFNFLEGLYLSTNRKEKLIKDLLTKPCTPELISREFKVE